MSKRRKIPVPSFPALPLLAKSIGDGYSLSKTFSEKFPMMGRLGDL